MAWLLVMFDLPVETKENRRDAARFRTDLISDGYMMVQYSVYARPCPTYEKTQTHYRRLQRMVPEDGEIRALTVTDAQWAAMYFVHGNQRTSSEKMPTQLLLF